MKGEEVILKVSTTYTLVMTCFKTRMRIYKIIPVLGLIMLSLVTQVLRAELENTKDIFQKMDQFAPSPFDLTLLGSINFRGSLDRLPIAIAELLKDDLKINHIRTEGDYNFSDVSEEVEIILRNPDKTPGNVALILNDIWNAWENPSKHVPEESYIKISYSLFESTELPKQWVEILNSKFDLVVVADEYYCSIYASSGVKIPVFALPHGIYIDEFLAEPIRKEPSLPFIFGCTSAFWPRKNQNLLVEAFHEEFGHDPRVQLQLHGRYYELDQYVMNLEKRLKELNNNSIKMYHETLSDRAFKEFFKMLDCYVLVSKGEGFSISPRESLALGKPCIISNNTAHKTICNAGHVYAVPSEIVEPAMDVGLGSCGKRFNCSVKDVRIALREVYTNYTEYVDKAREGREWVKDYRWENLKLRFLNLVKPKKVLLGDKNEITDEYLMTKSKQLYEKYSHLIDA